MLYKKRHLAPGRYIYDSENFDLVIWKFPYCVGDSLPLIEDGFSSDKVWNEVFYTTNEPYFWKVTACGPHDFDKKGSFSSFIVRTGSVPGNNGGKGTVRVHVSYPGMAAFYNSATPKILVQAFKSASFNGKPVGETFIANTNETAVLCGLDAGDYYIRAFVDQDDNYLRSNWESWGYFKNGNSADFTGRPCIVHASALADASPVTVEIHDVDTDGDTIPDALEFVRYQSENGGVPADDNGPFASQSWLSSWSEPPENSTATIAHPTPFEWLDTFCEITETPVHEDYEFAAESMSANGINYVWECYVLGLDPRDPDARFLATIDIVDGQPVIGYKRIGAYGSESEIGERTYTIEGKGSLNDEWGAQSPGQRYFRVNVKKEE